MKSWNLSTSHLKDGDFKSGGLRRMSFALARATPAAARNIVMTWVFRWSTF
jgi:hypothetical protein